MTTHKSEERTDSMQAQLRALCEAAKIADWQQVVLNGGPPCFHVEHGRFCLRAERWDGHGVMHAYVPLDAALRSAADALDAMQANDARPKSAEEALARQGVFAGIDGLRRFSNAAEFWERQMYGTRFYFGPGGLDYLHHSVLRAAIDALDGKPDYAARSAPTDAAAKGKS